ncbi:phosphocholine-specific phospholipase C [Polyangium jinanense]|nr:phospholipase C, phosphocholine-specific [Polyangium jinanense]
MSKLSRRSFLHMSGIAAGGWFFPGCIEKAVEIPAHTKTRSIMDVEHVVILIQENRSFDHYFGTMRGVRGFGDRFTLPLAEEPSVFRQRNGAEVILPYHLDSVAGNAQRVDGTPHNFVDGHEAWDHGRYGQWPAWKQPQSMGYYKRAELEFQFALAEAFTVCDAYFCSAHTSTNPNRLFAFTGTIDSLGQNGGPAIDNSHDFLGAIDAGYTWKTYAERLEEAGISWLVYQDYADNFSDNPLVGFQSFRKAFFEDQESPLFKKGIESRLSNQNLDGFREDVLAGRLPHVSWIVGPADYSEHPGPSSPVQGAWYVQQVLEALIENPEVFAKTVLFVTFDENDGFFDHVPPPCAPSRRDDGVLMGASTVDDTGERYDETLTDPLGGHPHGPGVRVPMWVVSPWSRGGFVCSENFDHTSILRFLEARFGVKETNISAYRRAMCGDLLSAFDFVTPNDEDLPMFPSLSQDEADAIRADQEQLAQVTVPTGENGSLPQQETGTRPSRALPYELEVRCVVDGDEAVLSFVNTGKAGAVFHVYDRLALTEIPRRYAVEPGKSLEGRWPATENQYSLFVLGPNGFHRDFVDAGSQGGLEIETMYDVEGSRLGIRCKNAGGTMQRFLVTPRAYTKDGTTLDVGPGETADAWFDVSGSGRWYDFSVTVEGQTPFSRRVAGRIENGQPSITDPAMGMPG